MSYRRAAPVRVAADAEPDIGDPAAFRIQGGGMLAEPDLQRLDLLAKSPLTVEEFDEVLELVSDDPADHT